MIRLTSLLAVLVAVLATGAAFDAQWFASSHARAEQSDNSPASSGLWRSSSVTFSPPANNNYLANPGIGWQHVPGIGEQLLPETVLYINRSDISWATVNPSEGAYDWSTIDAWIDQARSQGKQVSFRVYTMRGETWGGHQVPDWVLQKGAVILPSGGVDYANCTYQAEWARFVEALRQRYDGNEFVAFIDISGYGNFNEWSWQNQTTWEDDALNPTTLDGQARKRLADMYIGGADSAHQCQTASGATQTVSYSYPGFSQTQLVMPFAGVRQSSQYVASRRNDVGIRYDCLGKIDSTNFVIDYIGPQIDAVWRNAPIIYEFCAVDTSSEYMLEAARLLKASHGSVVHDNLVSPRDADAVASVMKMAGYRYQLDAITYHDSVTPGSALPYEMHWLNTGYAPSYPRMGQVFDPVLALVDANGTVVAEHIANANVAGWMPADPLPGTPPVNLVSGMFTIPDGLPHGSYHLRAGIRDRRTGHMLQLAIAGRDAYGYYDVGTVQVSAPSEPVTPTPAPATETPLPSATPTATLPPTETPLPSATSSATPTLIMPSATNTLVPPTATNTLVPPTATNTLVPPTATHTLVPSTSTPWPTPTTVPPTSTPWPTPTTVPPTSTPWPTPTMVMPSATPLPTQAPASVHVADLDGRAQNHGKTWTAEVRVRVESAAGQPVNGAQVTALWTAEDNTQQRMTCLTDAQGFCTVVSPEMRKKVGSGLLRVEQVVTGTMAYNPAANRDPDGDCDGTQITVWKNG